MPSVYRRRYQNKFSSAHWKSCSVYIRTDRWDTHQHVFMCSCASENDRVLVLECVCIRNLQNLITLRMDFICNEKTSLLSSAELFCPTQTWFLSGESWTGLASESHIWKIKSSLWAWEYNDNQTIHSKALKHGVSGPCVSSFLLNMSGPPESSYEVTIISKRRINEVCCRVFSSTKRGSTLLPALADEIPLSVQNQDRRSDYNLDSNI